jgi:hypothetical protein
VAAIAGAMPGVPPVCLVALDSNWGAPVSGRFDTDFLQVWAAADSRLKPQQVSLSGARNNSGWDIHADFELVSTVGDRQLYYLAFSSQYQFPSEFVIQMKAGDGTVHWDNNGGYGVNYRLVPYAGRVTSAVVGSQSKTSPAAPDGAIWLLPKFTSYRLVRRIEAAGEWGPGKRER